MARGGAKRKERIDPAIKLARAIVPAAQVKKGAFKIHDVANRTEADQRHMVRSGEKRTIRRVSHIEWLAKRKLISPRQAAVCEWYQRQHELGYEVSVGVTANYLGAGGGGFGPVDLLARHKAQYEARQNYIDARSAVPPMLLPLFERVVLRNGPLARLANSFRYAISRIDAEVGHLIAIED